MTATLTTATSPKAPSTAASAQTAGATHAEEQGVEMTGANFSLASDLWANPPCGAELIQTIGLVAGLVGMLFAAFGIALAVFGVA